MAQLNDLLVMGQSTLLGPININNTLNVTGTVTITKTTDAATSANNGPALIVGGSATSTHIEIDCNEVLAKSNGMTETDLYLGTTSSKVHIGQSTVGSASKPIYLSSGVPTACSSTVGGTAKPVYMSSGTLTECSANVGGTSQPVYMSSGTITACSSTVGDGTKPVYMSGGTVTASTSTVGSASKPVYMSSGTITACSSTVGSTTQPTYMSSGTITAGSTYAGGTKVTLNNSNKGASTASFYAPTSAGTSGQILTSAGSGAPSWTNRLPITSSAVGGAYVLARDSALLKTTESDSSSKYMALISGKTQLGEFSYGAIHPFEQMEWIYTTDTGYNASENTGLNADNTTGGYRRVLAVNSQGAVTAVSYNATSDKRLKTNLIPFISNHSILDLPLYRFDFIDGVKNQIGCMAQDLQEICPELVIKDPSTGYLSINESKIVYLLIDEVKKLKEEIEKLKYTKTLED